MDNIFIERLWRSVKYEEIYIKEFQSVEELRNSFSWGNTGRNISWKNTLTMAALRESVHNPLPTGIFCGAHSQGLCTLSLTAWV